MRLNTSILSLSIQLPRYGGAISATSSAMLRGTATTRLGVATAQVLYIVEEKPIALKKGKGAARGV